MYVLNSEIQKWIDEKIILFKKHYEYADNFRYALLEDGIAVKAYYEKKEQGCCGSYDEEFECPVDGKIYLIGFNYGH